MTLIFIDNLADFAALCNDSDFDIREHAASVKACGEFLDWLWTGDNGDREGEVYDFDLGMADDGRWIQFDGSGNIVKFYDA